MKFSLFGFLVLEKWRGYATLDYTAIYELVAYEHCAAALRGICHWAVVVEPYCTTALTRCTT